jgi:hypothetical protein
MPTSTIIAIPEYSRLLLDIPDFPDDPVSFVPAGRYCTGLAGAHVPIDRFGWRRFHLPRGRSQCTVGANRLFSHVLAAAGGPGNMLKHGARRMERGGGGKAPLRAAGTRMAGPGQRTMGRRRLGVLRQSSSVRKVLL